MSAEKKILLSAVFAVPLVFVQPSPPLLAADSDRCPGMTEPVCRYEEECTPTEEGGQKCSKDFYYFPNPE